VAEYCNIGESTIRFRSVIPRIRSGENNLASIYCSACEYSMAGAPQVNVVRRRSRGYFMSS